jgi:hypothetical protein
LKRKGLELIAVNSTDDRNTVSKYIAENKFAFVVGMEEVGSKHYKVSEKYGIQAYPTNYVIDPVGKVAYRSTGFDEPAIRKALEKLGVK